MVLTAHIFPEGDGFSIHCDSLGVYTQGPSRVDAVSNLADAIELTLEVQGLHVTVRDNGSDVLAVDASDAAGREALASSALENLRRKRERTGAAALQT